MRYKSFILSTVLHYNFVTSSNKKLVTETLFFFFKWIYLFQKKNGYGLLLKISEISSLGIIGVTNRFIIFVIITTSVVKLLKNILYIEFQLSLEVLWIFASHFFLRCRINYRCENWFFVLKWFLSVLDGSLKELY